VRNCRLLHRHGEPRRQIRVALTAKVRVCNILVFSLVSSCLQREDLGALVSLEMGKITPPTLVLGRCWWTVASQVATLANLYLTTWEQWHIGELLLYFGLCLMPCLVARIA
jgi:hypothetical protein